MRVDIVLADYAQVDAQAGKVSLIGGGWSISPAEPIPMAVVVFIEVPWDETNQPKQWRLDLLTADGQLVELAGPAGPATVTVDGQLEAGRPTGLQHGTPIMLPPLAVNVGPLPLDAGRYEWRFTVNGRSEDTWNRTFTKLTPGSAPAPGGR